MSNHEQPFRVTDQHYGPQMSKTKQNGGKFLYSAVQRGDLKSHEWADVLRELEPFY